MKTLHQTKQRIAALFLTFTLGVSAMGLAPMTPLEDGYYWIGDLCKDKPDAYTAIQCCKFKCNSVYKNPPNTGAYNDCVRGCKAKYWGDPMPVGPSDF